MTIFQKLLVFCREFRFIVKEGTPIVLLEKLRQSGENKIYILLREEIIDLICID